MTDLGEARWILGMEIIRDRGKRTLKLSQRQYVTGILTRFGFENARPASTPMAANQKLTKSSAPEMDAKRYQSALGSLMYAMLGTRPDFAYAVGALSRHAANPTPEHWSAVARVYKYLRGTTDMRLVYRGTTRDEELFAYVDADYASDPSDRVSITGHAFMIAGGAVSWQSKKQTSTAMSSTEAEYMGLASAAKEAVWLRALLEEIEQGARGPTLLLEDNQSAIALARNAEFHERTKHIGVRYHFIREKIESEEADFDLDRVDVDVLPRSVCERLERLEVTGRLVDCDYFSFQDEA